MEPAIPRYSDLILKNYKDKRITWGNVRYTTRSRLENTLSKLGIEEIIVSDTLKEYSIYKPLINIILPSIIYMNEYPVPYFTKLITIQEKDIGEVFIYTASFL